MTANRAPTVVVELTPPGRGAVAVVLVDGPNALEVVRQFFAPATPWRGNAPPIGRIMLGRWCGEQGEELVVCRRADNRFEIHCHGGVAAAPAIVEQLVEAGCQKLAWREWLLTGRSGATAVGESESRRDSATWAACAILAEAATARTAGVLLDQYHGALSSAVEAARAAIAAADATRAGEIVDGILEFRELGLHLMTPWRVVIAGAPNVGKSSLINAIAGYQRAIVSPLPGTTRDVVTITTAINGWPVRIADTAGLRETRDELESAGIALAGAAMESAELVIVVSDASAESGNAMEIRSRLDPSARVIRAINKVDLVDGGGDAPARWGSHTRCSNVQFVSALTGKGIAELLVAMERSLVPVAPRAGAAVAFMPSQIASLESARIAIASLDLSAAEATLKSLLAND